MTNHDYKAALEDFLKNWHHTGSSKGEIMDTIIHALNLADKLMQEPSEGMSGLYIKWGDSVPTLNRERNINTFKQMRDQMLREIE